MAVASQSLRNMSVTTDGAGSNQALLFPKLQFRFRLSFFNLGVDTASGLSLTRQVIDCGRPQAQFADITLHSYNSQISVAGKPSWSAVQANVRDDALGTVQKAIGQQIQKQFDFYEQSSAATAGDYKFQMNLEILDGGNGNFEPTILETWELYGCYIQSVNYNSLNYGTSDAVTVSLTIKFDNAVQTPLVSGVGQNVGRAYGNQASTGIGANTAL
jgi:hypothetical protein